MEIQPCWTIMVQWSLHCLLSMELEMGMQLHISCKGKYQQVRNIELQCTTQLHGCKLSNVVHLTFLKFLLSQSNNKVYAMLLKYICIITCTFIFLQMWHLPQTKQFQQQEIHLLHLPATILLVQIIYMVLVSSYLMTVY